MRVKYKWTLKLIIWTPISILISFILAGGGHGYYEPMIFLFPFSAILFFLFKEINSAIPLLIVLIQFPIYGLLLDSLERQLKSTWLLFLLFHLIIGVVAYSVRPEQFR